MSDKHLEESVRSAVEQALERQISSLREKVVADVLRELGSGTRSGPGQTSAAALQKAIAAIQAGSTQKEILRALLESTTLGSGRAALFVVKAGAASGWQAVGFSSNDAVKDSPLDIDSGLPAAAMQSRSAESGTASDMDQNFIARVGEPAEDNAVVLPLLLRDKVSALVYADAGTEGGTLDVSALDVLVRATSAWLEVISQRKQAQKEGGSEIAETTHATPAINDPFAAHSPIHSPKAQAMPVPAVEEAPATAMSVAAGAGSAAATTVLPGPVSGGEDSEIHHKAQRFARLLMDEIKLYNQAKVAEGRKHKDLYTRLKEDIEKSRGTYQKRYGNTAAGSADYFNQELIRSLAEDDVSLLGSNFRR
jgi:hypothetical protein